MGALCGGGNQKESDDKNNSDTIENFLEGRSTLDDLWTQFDKDNNGTIDANEFNDLVYHSLLHFCKQRNPDLPAPSRENMEPFIKKLVAQLQPFVDKDQDMQITREEFRGYGTYLTTEFKKLQKELDNGAKES